ncbi:MAG: hypothetical protein Q9165_008241 [Trypethelium subeluteriae]
MADDSNAIATAPTAEKPVDVKDSDVVTDSAEAAANPTSTDPVAPEEADTGAEADIKEQEKAQDTNISDDKVDAPTEETATPQVESAAGTKATPASANKKEKRKSGGGVPEHKTKKLNSKKSKPDLHLDIQAGEFWWARMKGYPPWPAVVCDEEMLPETLLKNRPVSAARTDGSYREDFLEGNKNAKERTYPIMYLGTNEFSWIKNTDLSKIDVAEIKKEEQGKKPKNLWNAYEICAEEHDLQHFKDVLREHEKAMSRDAEERDRKQAEKEEKAAKKAERTEKAEKRKSKGKAEDEDEEMEDAEPKPKTPASKKRKSRGEPDGEDEKPAKTPKTSTKLKLGSKQTPNGESSTTKSGNKNRKIVTKPSSDDDTENKEGEKPLTEAEKLEKRRKTVLYLRHRLQKGFLAREAPPKEEEMETMNDFFTQLESYADLELSILKTTKIHKVLKAILKLSSIPKEDEYHFMDRSNRLLQGWNKVLVGDEKDDDVEEKAEGAVNGEKAEATAESAGKEDGEKAEGDGDVEMKEAKEDVGKGETAAA